MDRFQTSDETLEDRGVVAKSSRAPVIFLTLFCFVYFCSANYLSLLKLRLLAYVGQDIGYFTQCLFTSLHGQLFYSNMYHDLLYNKPVTSDFASHNQLVLFLFVPPFWIANSAATLLVVRNLFIALCAIPTYLIARLQLSPWLSCFAAIAFLSMPAVAYQNVYDFAPLSLAAFPLLFAVWFLRTGKFAHFAVALFLTQTVREDLVFVVFGMGLLAFLLARSTKWIATPIVLAIAWALLSWKFVFPHFLNGATSAVATCFAYLGSNPAQISHHLWNYKRDFLSHNNLVYVKQLVDSFGGLLFLLNPAWLLAVPYVAINLLAQVGGCNTAMIYRHYSLLPAAILFVSFLFSLKRFAGVRSKLGVGFAFGAGSAVLFVLAASISSTLFVTGAQQIEDFRPKPWLPEAQSVIAHLPKSAAIAVPRYMLPAVADRPELYQSLRLLEYHRPNPELIVMDKDWERLAATDQWKSNYYQLWDFLASSPAYSIEYESPSYVVYRHCAGCASDLPHTETHLMTHE